MNQEKSESEIQKPDLSFLDGIAETDVVDLKQTFGDLENKFEALSRWTQLLKTREQFSEDFDVMEE